MRRFEDLTGQKFHRLLVIRRDGTSSNGSALWQCLCDCGNMKSVTSAHLKGGYIQSCGCKKKEASRNSCIGRTKHGARSRINPIYARLYSVWKNMRDRCENPGCHAYENYGARGISVCEEWQDFNAFKEWAIKTGYDVNAPYGVFTIERKDVNKGYNPQNCCWISMKEQAENRRLTRNNSGKFTRVVEPPQEVPNGVRK